MLAPRVGAPAPSLRWSREPGRRASPAPVVRRPDCEGGSTWAQDCGGLNPDDDCDADLSDDDNNEDGDLALVLYWAYGASFRGTAGMLDLFRRTADAVRPVSAVETIRTDGEPLRARNSVPFRVAMLSATDDPNPYLRAAGVWKRWGKVDGVTPSLMPDPDQTPYWLISGDGEHDVQLLSTDVMGNVESGENALLVRVDMTPPEVAFPDLRPNYITSQTFTAIWSAGDVTSGAASEVAYLDDAQVTKGQTFDIAPMAGLHSLRVIVYDRADNWTDVSYECEVWIAADGWCQPVVVSDRTLGEALTCVVELPAFYDVGMIALHTTRRAVKGDMDLYEQDPVLGETADLPGLLLTGVGDHDKDGVGDRKMRFDDDAFVAVPYGQTGNLPSIIRGSLLPNGLPHFLAPVVMPVFSAPR